MRWPRPLEWAAIAGSIMLLVAIRSGCEYRDRWIDRNNELAAADSAKARTIEGYEGRVSELRSYIARTQGEMRALAGDTGAVAEENRRLRRRLAVAVSASGELEARLDSAEVKLARVRDDTLRLETEARQALPSGSLLVRTRATVPLLAPERARVSHDVSGRFAVDVRLLVGRDGTPTCQVAVPGDVFRITPSRCAWADERPGPPEVPALSGVRLFSVRLPPVVTHVGVFLGGVFVGRAAFGKG